MSWLQLQAMVNFSDNLEIKEKILDHNSLVKGIYKNPTNLNLKVFYLADGKASVSEIGKPPICYSF